MAQQERGGAGIFGKDQIDLLQDPYSPEGDIFEVTDWRWNKIQFTHGRSRNILV
jgi:hypothetical protein